MKLRDARLVLADVDGVLADIHTPLCEIVGLDQAAWVPGEYWFEKAFGVSSSAVWEHPRIKDPAFWSEAPKTRWADALMAALLSVVPKDRICFLTKPVREQSCASAKVAWLQRHFPGIHYLVGTSKKFCAAPGNWLIDDFDENCAEFRAHGGEAILLPRIWNSGHARSPERGADPLAAIREVL
jgi:hypothetical protein